MSKLTTIKPNVLASINLKEVIVVAAQNEETN